MSINPFSGQQNETDIVEGRINELPSSSSWSASPSVPCWRLETESQPLINSGNPSPSPPSLSHFILGAAFIYLARGIWTTTAARASGASTHTEGNDARGDERSEKDAWHEHASDIASESAAMWRCFEFGKDSRKILQYKFGKGHHFLSGLLNLK